MSKEDIDKVYRSISVEHFENFDADTQLQILHKLRHSLHVIRAAEMDFAPQQFEELSAHIEDRLNELQIIYNIRSNKTLNDFWE